MVLAKREVVWHVPLAHDALEATMKSRDELAEAFAVALVGADIWADDLVMTKAFAYADAFVAERERRAVDQPECDSCDRPATHADRDDSGARTEHIKCCGSADCCDVGNGWSRAPLAPENASDVRTVTEGLMPGSATVVPHDPERGCAGCDRFVPATAVAWAFCGPAYERDRMMDDHAPSPAPSWCPKRAKPGALRFVDQGSFRYLASDDGAVLSAWERDPFGAGIYPSRDGFVVEVKVRATSRAHAERIVAAMLPVGRGVK